MATPKLKTVETPAAPATTFGTGRFTFAPVKVASIPVPAETAPQRTKSPITEFYDHCLKLGASAAHGQTIFVPNAYWTAPREEGGRGLEKLPNGGNMRQKLRDGFKTWVKADETIRGCMGCLVIERKEGEAGPGGEPFPEAGFSVFVIDKGRT